MSIKIILKNSIVSFRNNESNIRASRKIELLEIDVVFFFSTFRSRRFRKIGQLAIR